MALIEALHCYGIASCVFKMMEYKEWDLKFIKIDGNIPENEKVILFIAISYYKSEFTYATSHRKEQKNILKVKW